MPRFKLLAGRHVQAKYPGVRRKARLMDKVPEERRLLERLYLSELKQLANEVLCPIDPTDDEHSLITRLLSDDVYDSRNPKRNIVVSEFNLEEKFGREKFQNLDSLMMSDPNNETLINRLAELERENAQLKQQMGSKVSELPDLQKMTVKQLAKYAKDQLGIADIDESWSKAEIIQVIEEEAATATQS